MGTRVKVGRDVHGVAGKNKGKVKITVSPEDRARVQAVRAATADLLAVLDDDTELDDERAAKIRRRAEKLERETVASKGHPDGKKVRRWLTGITATAGAAEATGRAVQALRTAVEALL
jgi:hypothetical protein